MLAGSGVAAIRIILERVKESKYPLEPILFNP